MNDLKKTGGYNLFILVVYTILVSVFSKGNQWQMNVMILLAMLISVQVGINLLLSLIFFLKREKVRGRNFLLSAFLILIIGFSTCYGLASI
jgi:uncharacterized membrane protein YozB (DUF420 family)